MVEHIENVPGLIKMQPEDLTHMGVDSNQRINPVMFMCTVVQTALFFN